MCGILGEFCLAGHTGKGDPDFARLVSLMVRRGPDDQGIWMDGETCTLGFRRLSILDLSSSGHQPMLSSDGRFALVFNGEVYNFPDLRLELERDGVNFRSSGDAEVVLYALAKWGLPALDRLNGMFALGFFDSISKTLLLARDHAGIKPLYYHLSEKGIVFASQYNQILNHQWTRDLELSQESLSIYLQLGYLPAPHAILKHTYQLEPGSWIKIGQGGEVRKGRYYEFPDNHEPILRGWDAYEAVDTTISAAVRRQLVSDVPLGVLLSGGIDSPLVAAKMRENGRPGYQAFTIGVGSRSLDESEDARIYAGKLGLEHIIQQINPMDALGILADVVEACGEPFADYSIFPMLLVSRLASERVKVVLSGDGGDELFWGYVPRFSAVLKLSSQFSQPTWLRRSRWLMRKYLKAGSASWALQKKDIGTWYQEKHTRLPDPWRKKIFPDLPLPSKIDLFDFSGWEADETAQWLRRNEFMSHLTMVLAKVDRASMHHSLEVRVPLLDREVIKTACQVDWKSCLDIDQNIGKLPLRYALGKSVQHQTLKKRGFEVPMADWMRGELGKFFAKTMFDRKEILGVPMSPEGIKSLYFEHQIGHVNHEQTLWLLLSLVLWEEHHLRPNRASG